MRKEEGSKNNVYARKEFLFSQLIVKSIGLMTDIMHHSDINPR